jgi:hypothetical protein
MTKFREHRRFLLDDVNRPSPDCRIATAGSALPASLAWLLLSRHIAGTPLN